MATFRSDPLTRAVYRALVHAHRQLARLERLLGALPVAFHDAALERYASDLHYRQTSRYRDPADQHRGLFPFEERMLARFFPPPPARLLVPGAGGGRELVALLARGYDVVGFDPVAPMVEAAKRALGAADASRVELQTLQEWSLRPDRSYGGIVTGWEMWTHIVDRAARLAALRAFRVASPVGPVLLSFWRGDLLFDPEERAATEAPREPPPASRIETLSRDWLRRHVLGRPPLERGTGWESGMFVHRVVEIELRQEAEEAGYRVVHYERDATRFPHAVLSPAAAKSPEGT